MLLQIRIYNFPLTQGIKDLRKPMSYMIFYHIRINNQLYSLSQNDHVNYFTHYLYVIFLYSCTNSGYFLHAH